MSGHQMILGKKRLDYWAMPRAILVLAALMLLSPSHASAVDVAAIEKAIEDQNSANFMEIQFTKPKAKEKVIVIMSNLDKPSIDMIMLFKNDQCDGNARHQQGNGRFNLKCANGGELASKFACTSESQCFMRGSHSQRGKFILNFKHKIQTMPLEDILNYSALAVAKAAQTPSAQPNATAGTGVAAVNTSTTSLSVVSKTVQSPTPSVVSSSESGTSAVTVSTTPTSSVVSVSASSTKWREAQNATEAQRFVDEIQASIVMFEAISDVINQQSLGMKDRVLRVVSSEIVRLRQEKQLLQEQLSSRFSTPIRPNNANLSVSAFRASDTFPKIPFYVPGTNEIGEMLVVPRVSDEGYLNYQFDFLDPTSTYDKVRDSIDVAHDDIGSLIFGLNKVDEWTKVAQENNVNRRIEKTASCIPDGMCAEKKQGVSSTEVIFQVYEDGSTAGRIQRNKGKFMVGYNMSVESSILLSAYLIYMRDVGAKEFNIGVMSDEEVQDLFN